MIQTLADAKGWLEAKGGTWTMVRRAEGWEVIAWVGPFSRRQTAEGAAPEGAIDRALVGAVAELDRDPVLSLS
jgi:hypothetical protein